MTENNLQLQPEAITRISTIPASALPLQFDLDHKDHDPEKAELSRDSADSSSTLEPDLTTAEGLELAYGPPPDGGKEAWMMVLGGCLAATSAYGMLASYGAFNTYYAEHLLPDYPVSTISWIGSCSACLTFILSVFGGSFYDRHGARKLMMTGTGIQVTAWMMISLCTKFWQLLLAHGVFLPLGLTLLLVVPLALVNQWFSKRKGLAVGLILSFSSWGAICWPLLVSKLPAKVGWPWTARIIGFMQLILLSTATYLLKTRLPPKSSAPIMHLKAYSIRKPAYLLLSMSAVAFTWGFFFFVFYIGSYASQNGYGEKGSYLLIICNGASGFGRIGSGFLADRVGRFNVCFCGLLVSAIVIFFWQLAHSFPAMVVISALYGIATGGNMALQPVCVAQVTEDPRLIGTMIGQIISLQSVAGLLGPPVSGYVLGTTIADQIKHFPYAIILNGGMLLVGALCVGAARFTLERRLWAKV